MVGGCNLREGCSSFSTWIVGDGTTRLRRGVGPTEGLCSSTVHAEHSSWKLRMESCVRRFEFLLIKIDK